MAENLVYRGHPLRRVDNLVYYGSMADKYNIMMQVLDTEVWKRGIFFRASTTWW